jgi:hypothetical protein
MHKASKSSGALKTAAVVLALSYLLVSCGGRPIGRVTPIRDQPITPVGSMNFKCGFNEATSKSECTCSGDADCNKMFESGFCKGTRDNASCDTGTGTCRCDLK